ncbi:DUF6695 family protein [Aquimarina rhabdastrellae]
MKPTGKIIPLAFPDTYVKHSDESVLTLLPLLGLGKKNYIKAGHAALVLIENATGHAAYYDFGRYITPKGHGRVRSALTDVELEIPFTMQLTPDRQLVNLDELLLWLEAHPDKTHGSGRLVASVCDEIDYHKAKEYLDYMQGKGSIPYKAFGKIGTNCSRIVTDTILAATTDDKIIKGLLKNKRFTPSPLGNIGKSSKENIIYEVFNGKIKPYGGSILKENLTNYFHKDIPTADAHQDRDIKTIPDDAYFLSGTGSSAYFRMEATEKTDEFIVYRYTACFTEDFRGIFKIESASKFEYNEPYKFTYDSNCSFCHIVQNEEKFRLECIKRL